MREVLYKNESADAKGENGNSPLWWSYFANPLTPMSDQNRVSPYNINTILSRKVMRIYQNIKKQLLVDPIPSSPNSHHKNCMAESKENYKWDLESENINQKLGKWRSNLLLVCPTDKVYVRKESERCLERRKQEQENTNKQQSIEP